MPYPAQVDRDTIVATAHALIETEGVAALSLGRLAKQLGIKAPSLYRHIGSKTALMQAVNTYTTTQLFAAFDAALQSAPADAMARLMAVALAYRRFAHAHPHTYVAAMNNTVDAYRPDEDALVQLVLPLQAMMADISGETESLTALRGALALIHGYVMLELSEQLRRGGDLEAAFRDALAVYLQGWQRRKDA